MSKQKKHVAESVTAPATAITIEIETLIGTDAAEKVSQVPLSNDTLYHQRIEKLSSDIKDQVREYFDTEDQLSLLWALQVDGATDSRVEFADSTGKTHLLAYTQFIKNAKYANQCLFCKELKTLSREEDIFELVNEHILF